MTALLNRLHEGLWERNEAMTVLGMAIGHRMTVARLGDGSLWVHSPVAYSAELAASLDALGSVAHIVAPNYVHDTYLEGWLPNYPGVRFHAPRSFHKVFPRFRITDALGETPDPSWAGLIDQHAVQGAPRLHEVVFLHRPSRTLIVADLSFNLGRDMPWLSRQLCRVNGCYDHFGPSRLFRSVIRDRAALRASIDRILGWDFDRLVVGHGAVIETGGKAALREAFSFLA
ncbi:MAG TPA: DUF4336 domain-containing protein [Opitutaceae bacterium]|nr:DUF4336 domain-containing protein [Opitutaceae bacterium]